MFCPEIVIWCATLTRIVYMSANGKRLSEVDSMLVHCVRRLTHIEPALMCKRLLFAGRGVGRLSALSGSI